MIASVAMTLPAVARQYKVVGLRGFGGLNLTPGHPT